MFRGSSFVGVDGISSADESTIQQHAHTFVRERLRASEFHPDAWPVIVVRDPGDVRARLAVAAGDRYTYRELDDYTDLLARAVKTLPMVSKVTRTGLLQERVYLEYHRNASLLRSHGQPAR